MRANLAAAWCLGLIVLGGCQTMIEYGPVDGEVTPVYGYQETQTKEGEYILMIRAFGGTPENVHAMWDRRATELCGPEYQKKLYRAERPTTTYGSYGGAPGNMILEGFLLCGSEPKAGS
jgi:hypothetical protein